MKVRGVLETALYVPDLEAAEAFYSSLLGLELIARREGRHVFFRCGAGVLLLFDPERTATETTSVDGAEIPRHGARGPGHVALRIAHEEIPAWRERLRGHGVALEREVRWPEGGRSLYFRDPAGNSIELATPDLWGLAD